MDFTCNVCGKKNTGVENFGREVQNCVECRSTVRIRGLMYTLSMELFGAPLTLPDFPVLKALRAMGMTDSACYTEILARKFDYKNTFFDREPRLDITAIDGLAEGALDVVISSEVMEHVRPPVEKAFENVFRLLRSNGLLLLTVPYALSDFPSLEHYPKFADAGLAQLNSGMVLVNRTEEGELQVFDNLVFHLGSGSALEMRVLNEAALKCALKTAGFNDLQFYGQDYPPFGIYNMGQWSLPVAARKQPFELGASMRAELMSQYRELLEKLRGLEAELLRVRTAFVELTAELESRTKWAWNLNQEISQLRPAIEELQTEFEKRTAWALDLERQLAQSDQFASETQSELESRTTWALDLANQLEERTKWALDLDASAKALEDQLAALRARRWTRFGRMLKVMP